ncbi:hemagglutination activity protein [Sulfuricaulis limicola]|uniref:Heme exporter protein D n=1 Tax=Sulfuricaulis limicola TaxID=1620215 RepID=A0A1B4XEH5_9GAMM|nr:heme exporter protein CcmD [Sulfuricaulis limicola]BAV33217.1 hemagglutination activity protein [Sulfuricaulis limicola]
MNWTEFFAMGGYGLYVWSSYGLAALILILNLYLPLRRRQAVRRQLREFMRLKEQTR